MSFNYGAIPQGVREYEEKAASAMRKYRNPSAPTYKFTMLKRMPSNDKIKGLSYDVESTTRAQADIKKTGEFKEPHAFGGGFNWVTAKDGDILRSKRGGIV